VSAAIVLEAERPVAPFEVFLAHLAQAIMLPLRCMMGAPTLWFLVALTAMLLRHPDVAFYEIDRIAFGLLLVGVVARALVQHRPMFRCERATWPMIGLIALALASVISEPFDHETWSLLASKFLVPFALFHIAADVFINEKRLRQFEIFSVIVLAYLSFTAIAFLTGARSLIFPRFILDESLGFHADRARGPLLQAVANGVSLNLLALIALHAYQRGSLRGLKVLLVLMSVPIAILATMTRAVWLSFAGSATFLVAVSKHCKLRRLCLALIGVSAVGVLIVLGTTEFGDTLKERLQERGPVDYREAVYAGGWEMFLERPLLGWGFHQMPAELPLHVSGYHEKVLYPHNTYLELLVEHGLVGLALYAWLMWELWRLRRGRIPPSERHGFLDSGFHRLWPILLAVYWVNAAMVAMSYQFVNGIVFSIAGMLAAQHRRAEEPIAC
jgi:putative inorganic carbon (hco3(-)) transporter